MISSIQEEIGGKSYTLKLSTRAQARVEREIDASISLVLAGLGTKFGVNAICEIIAASLNDGKGGAISLVYDMVDDLGMVKARGVVERLVSAAFDFGDTSDQQEASDSSKK